MAAFGDRSVHADVRDALHDLGLLFVILRKIILADIVSTEGQNQVLQDVNRGLSAQKEDEFAQEFTLAFGSFHTLLHCSDFWRVLELVIDNIVVLLSSLVEELASICLHLADLVRLEQLASHGEISLSHRVGQTQI